MSCTWLASHQLKGPIAIQHFYNKNCWHDFGSRQHIESEKLFIAPSKIKANKQHSTTHHQRIYNLQISHRGAQQPIKNHGHTYVRSQLDNKSHVMENLRLVETKTTHRVAALDGLKPGPLRSHLQCRSPVFVLLWLETQHNTTRE